MKRRHDIDALRAFAFASLILYHVCMFYVADWGWHVKSRYTPEWLQWPMLFMNRWRMDLIFLVSGVSTAFLLRKSARGDFFRQRSWRLLLPLFFGMIVIVPLQPYCQGVANRLVEPGFWTFLMRYYSGYPWPAHAFDGWEHGFTWNHLWYLAYLWTYSMLLLAALPMFTSAWGRRVQSVFQALRGPRLLIWPAAPLLLYAAALQTRFPQTHDLIHDWYWHPVYATMFIYGWWLGQSDEIWQELSRLRRIALAAALCLFAAYLFLVKNQDDNLAPWTWYAILALRSLFIWTMICAVLGWSHALLNRPFRWLDWANESVYPWYILHQTLIVGIGFAIGSLAWGPVLEPICVLAGTVIACWVLNDLLIRRVNFLRPLFGLKPHRGGSAGAREPNRNREQDAFRA
jgi:hypothetical protein